MFSPIFSSMASICQNIIWFLYLPSGTIAPACIESELSGITFFNTLFDENASNHLAIGAAYATSVEGGVDMTEEELKEAGLNRSDVHVDFMIGSNQMDIDGIRQDGSRVPIFRNGDWVI